ncbi:DNA-methyltransferase [Mycobacterium avium]|uniref:DNA-methyltransferase n=1 Tax=Mycobacterium avium TaxID=1764 RepID=UPI000A038433|nr:site-specific DNA-methyltransferase [Mycobacterium avium]
MPAPFYFDDQVTLYHGDALAIAHGLPTGSIHSIVTSPPYFWQRDYSVTGQYGLEATPAAYVQTLRRLFSELRRVLAADGTLWLNLGDSYAGSWGNQSHDSDRGDLHTKVRPARQFKTGTHTGTIRPGMPPGKNMHGIPWRTALALQDDGWILRNAVIWAKPNSMPESVTDRLAGRYEFVFLFAKQRTYWFDLDAIREPHADVSLRRAMPHRTAPGRSMRDGHGLVDGASPQTLRLDQMNHAAGRNPGDIWTIATKPFTEAHFAVMPEELARRCILAGCKPGGTVLDPFSGSGTTGLAAQRTGRRYIGIDINRDYLELSLRTRLRDAAIPFPETVGDQPPVSHSRPR